VREDLKRKGATVTDLTEADEENEPLPEALNGATKKPAEGGSSSTTAKPDKP
jgi:hypothetical protein